MSTQILNGAESGRHIVDGPVTVAITNEAVPGLIRNAIDDRIVKVRPMATPIDQLSRCGGSRHADGMVVNYYSVDPKETEARVKKDVTPGLGNRRAENVYTHVISTDNDMLFEPSETLMFPTVTVSGHSPLVVYVVDRLQAGGLEVMVINGDGDTPEMPPIPKGSRIVRMGRAASELDVQTPQFQALPTKRSNNCQIFKMQVEESTMHKIASKEVGWSFSDQEEAAIIDMRLGMEKNFIFGAGRVVLDPSKNGDVYLTEGIWNQATEEQQITLDDLDEKTLIDIAKAAFTGNSGSKRKIFICGSELLSRLSKIECSKVRRSTETRVKWGLAFNEVITNFGSLYIIHSDIFDQCGHSCDGMIIDPAYLTKYVHIPFYTEQLDLRRSGQRNTSAVVITEASCLVLRYPKSHLRVVGVLVDPSNA